jgi:hypothetical protein
MQIAPKRPGPQTITRNGFDMFRPFNRDVAVQASLRRP